MSIFLEDEAWMSVSNPDRADTEQLEYRPLGAHKPATSKVRARPDEVKKSIQSKGMGQQFLRDGFDQDIHLDIIAHSEAQISTSRFTCRVKSQDASV